MPLFLSEEILKISPHIEVPKKASTSKMGKYLGSVMQASKNQVWPELQQSRKIFYTDVDKNPIGSVQDLNSGDLFVITAKDNTSCIGIKSDQKAHLIPFVFDANTVSKDDCFAIQNWYSRHAHLIVSDDYSVDLDKTKLVLSVGKMGTSM